MIRAGRDVVDRLQIAALADMSPSVAAKRKPWNATGHPAPITTYRPTNGRPQMWDKEQAEAFAAGQPVPQLPDQDSPDDLLDRFEAAELAGMTPVAWESAYHQGRFPSDDDRLGVPMWHRRTVEAIRDNPPAFKKPKGPTGNRQRRSQELEQRIRELLHEPGPRLSDPDIAQRLGVHVNTVFKHRTRIEAAEQAPAPASE
ncbi:hypothetical protein [Lentzea sp. NBRC 102530]|uniref:hypothetical protein n=1 Tax=Lentzea sp. NBRC 102530 TaxID=3032201 RepID=UPI00249F9862|nr:hypothetical protein [Lentzea sp. NBRC 102530]GLY54862.1 hypothetical protein Lesp01_85170 [Lentzea sp. NBRC 102530]